MELMEKDKNEGLALPTVPVVRFAPIGELRIYAVSQDELDRLGKGGEESVYLNFALALLPTSLTLFIALITTTIASNRLYVAFLTAAIATLIAGLVLLALWSRNRGSNQALVKKIEGRMPPPLGVQVLPLSENPPGAKADRTV